MEGLHFDFDFSLHVLTCLICFTTFLFSHCIQIFLKMFFSLQLFRKTIKFLLTSWMNVIKFPFPYPFPLFSLLSSSCWFIFNNDLFVIRVRVRVRIRMPILYFSQFLLICRNGVFWLTRGKLLWKTQFSINNKSCIKIALWHKYNNEPEEQTERNIFFFSKFLLGKLFGNYHERNKQSTKKWKMEQYIKHVAFLMFVYGKFSRQFH